MILTGENRVLCSDGNCIGVIGTDGRCKECGLKPDQSGEKIFMDTDENDNLDSSDIKDQPDSLEIDDTSPDKDADWEDRVLCSDETCIGTIGPGGTCNECGKPHS